MNRSSRSHLLRVVKIAKKGIVGVVYPSGYPSGQNHGSNPLVAQQHSIDFSASGQDERVLDCSDWYANVGCAGVLEEVSRRADQLNNGGLECPSPMSPSTPTGVDGATTPMPAGIKAGTSVNPTVRRKIMEKNEFLSPCDVLGDPRHSAFVDALTPVNGHTRSDVDGQVLKYVHSNERITWWGVIIKSPYIEYLEVLEKSLYTRGVDKLAGLRFPFRSALMGPDEALDFWQQILPVKTSRIMFALMGMNFVYVQLTSGQIIRLSLEWDGAEVDDETLINSIFMQITESRQVGQ